MLKDILASGFIGIVILLVLIGTALCFTSDDIVTEIEYYENNIKIDAVKYHNEIYLKKGE
jgi:hypothetical protein